ncbi:Poly-gamma-glutamate synthesis protein (Capsule biosynthesis protein) OS=Streptomyces griseomycini OX=66895 GN=FHS37_006047 PE=3 SV=1 [Streptomyces griseomycini]
MLSGIRSVVAGADVALCHMETVYGVDGDYTGHPVFAEVAARGGQALAATEESPAAPPPRQTPDDGPAGHPPHPDALDGAGRYMPDRRDEQEARTAAVLRAGSARVARPRHAHGTDGLPLPPDRPGR